MAFWILKLLAIGLQLGQLLRSESCPRAVLETLLTKREAIQSWRLACNLASAVDANAVLGLYLRRFFKTLFLRRFLKGFHPNHPSQVKGDRLAHAFKSIAVFQPTYL